MVTFAGVLDFLKAVRDLLQDSAIALARPGLRKGLGLFQHDDPGDLSVDLGSDSQELPANLLELLGGGRVGLDELQQHAHDVHPDEGQKLLLVDALTGADLDRFVSGSSIDHDNKFKC